MQLVVYSLINNNDKNSICYSQNFKSNCASQISHSVATEFVSIYITIILAQTMTQAIFQMVVPIDQLCQSGIIQFLDQHTLKYGYKKGRQ